MCCEVGKVARIFLPEKPGFHYHCLWIIKRIVRLYRPGEHLRFVRGWYEKF